uniref:Seven TM Receptor n=1 Tax=Caenorhabditis tropicalis TaxID=1561998 RepID=A0A1I7U9F5_9PELO
MAMSTVEWLKLETVVQRVCGVISIITNSFLMFLILTKSPSKLGKYKWLMLYTSIFELAYAFLNFFVGPSMHNFGSVCMVFQDMKEFWFSHETAQVLIVVYCSFLVLRWLFSLFISCIDTALSICIDFKQKYITGFKQIFLYIGPILCGSFWGLACAIFMSESKFKSDFLRDRIKQKFLLDIDDCAYIALYFWPTDRNGGVYPDLFSFIGVILMYIILGASFISVIYFGVNCYRYISKRIESVEHQSETSKTLHTQLFYSLLVQSVIPFILMYLPATIVFTFPMLNIDLDLNYPFIGITIAIFPVVDPLPTILIIKSYREGCAELFCCKKKNQVSGDFSNNVIDLSTRPSVANIIIS